MTSIFNKKPLEKIHNVLIHMEKMFEKRHEEYMSYYSGVKDLLSQNAFMIEGFIQAADLEEKAQKILSQRTKAKTLASFANQMNYTATEPEEEVTSSAVQELKEMIRLGEESRKESNYGSKIKKEEEQIEMQRLVQDFEKKKRQRVFPVKSGALSSKELQSKYRIQDIEHFSPKTLQLLIAFAQQHNIIFLGDLKSFTAAELLRYPGFNSLNIREIKGILGTYGIKLNNGKN